jgi:hydroxymethylbilane synthase
VTALDATCHTPVGALARLEGDRLSLSGYVGAPDGSTWVRDRLEVDRDDDPAALGREMGERLLAAGAGALLG